MVQLLVPLSHEAEAKVLAEIGTDHQRFQEDVTTIKEWMATQEHLPLMCGHEDDTLIKVFLVSTKNKIDRCKEKLDKYYTMRTVLSDLYRGIDPLAANIQKSASLNYVVTLPQPTLGNMRVSIGTTEPSDLMEHDFRATAKRWLLMVETRARYDPINGGEVIILDCKNYKLGHAFKLTPNDMKLIATIGQAVLPVRVKKIMFINAPQFYVKMFNNLIKPLLSNNIASRVLFYSEGPSVLYQHIPRHILPQDYGGDDLSLQEMNRSWMREFENRRDWFLKEWSRGTDESKRAEKGSFPKQDTFGVYGSFKQLNID